MKLIYDFTKPTEENIVLHTCNGIAHTFDRIENSPAYIYTVFVSDESIMTYASTSDYDLFKLD